MSEEAQSNYPKQQKEVSDGNQDSQNVNFFYHAEVREILR